MVSTKKDAVKQGSAIMAFFAIVSVPMAMSTGSIWHMLIITLAFGVPTCYLQGAFDPKLWGLRHDGLTQPTRVS